MEVNPHSPDGFWEVKVSKTRPFERDAYFTEMRTIHDMFDMRTDVDACTYLAHAHV